MTWAVYVVLCADDTLYTGVTTNVSRRVRQHNGEIAGGAKYTRSRRPVILLVSWTADSRSSALKQEYSFKHLTRAQKQRYIEERTHAKELLDP